jgi:hypothetical protein
VFIHDRRANSKSAREMMMTLSAAVGYWENANANGLAGELLELRGDGRCHLMLGDFADHQALTLTRETRATDKIATRAQCIAFSTCVMIHPIPMAANFVGAVTILSGPLC